ncbi:MAG TPA: TonB-dependent receptor [Parasegetibacter sp.]
MRINKYTCSCRYLVGLIFMILLSLTSLAQQDTTLKKITGVVKSAKDGTVLENVSVLIKGTNRGTMTDEYGRFEIVANPGDTLVISAVGFRKLQIAPKTSQLMALSLPEDHSSLNEVLIVGYGNERKRNITGSISSISAKDIERTHAISFDNAIIGKAAGVNIISSSGVPGSATGITIRGLSTLNADGNQPLIVIDGVPVYGTGRSLNNRSFRNSTAPAIGFGGVSVSDNIQPEQTFENNPLAALNPADIESIEILKDAYATAIYGSRASAGVILVTTKKGRKGTQAFNVRYVTGAVMPIGKHKLLSGPEYNAVYTQYYKELGTNQVFSSPYDTDWVDEITRTAVTHQVDASMSAGTDKAQYFISGSFLDQPSYVINNDYKRYTGRVNLIYRASEKLTTGVNMWMSFSDNTSMNAPQIYRTALTKAPSLPVYTEDGRFAYGKGINPYGDLDANPVADALLNTNRLQTSEGLGNIYLQFKPVSWLTLQSEFGTQISNGEAYTRRLKRPSGFGDDAVQSVTQNRKIVLNNTINFLKSSDNHYVNALVGQSYEQSTESRTAIGGYGFFSDDISSIAAATNKYISASLTQKWALVSYFARVNYEYNNKYLAGITYRLDGSSRFSRNRRYVGFPSFSVGWRLSEEMFLRDKIWLDDLKIRGSVGFTGNNNLTSYYGSLGQYVLNSNNLSYGGIPILQMQQPDNPNLKWERTRSVDIGIDATLLNNRISITLDYYHRRIRDMVLNGAIPRYQGWVSQPQNVGDMMNSGVELMIEADIIRNQQFSWSTSFNIARNYNKILKLTFNSEEVGLANEAFKYLKEGEPAAQFYLYEWVGVDPMTGNPMWNDGKDNISFIPPASLFNQVDDVNVFRKPYGSSLPEFFGGLGNTLVYRNWELHAFLSYAIGNKMINGSRASLLTYATADANNLSREILDYWLVPGHETDVPKLTNKSITASPGVSGIRDYTTSRTNSRFLEDASYLRLRTIRLSYRLNAANMGRMNLKGIRAIELFASGTNLLTLTKYSGLDPEVNAFGSSALHSGYDELTMPQNKIVQFGINIGL